ncbi:MAG TPA: type II toxin-antitoxin system death-on-curing family toxin [Solirubrobacteraceae bacterium]|nr:type II toxin-antitoxin system death-on-curing family toxin [Solirubrobacteraceae bacterium]
MIPIEEFLVAAEAVLGIDADRLKNVTKIGAAESALAAPFATYGGHDFYTHPIKRAAVLASRIVRNHPLPDGNKRVALLLMDLYLEEHGWHLTCTQHEIAQAIDALAAKKNSEDYFHMWLISRTERTSPD